MRKIEPWVWVGGILVVLAFFFYSLNTKTQAIGGENLTLGDGKLIISSYKLFVIMLAFLIGMGLGRWFFRMSQRRVLKGKKLPFLHLLWNVPIAGVVVALLGWLFYLLGTKYGWFGLDMIGAEEWDPKWWGSLIKVKSIFGHLGSSWGFEIITAADLFVWFLVGFSVVFLINFIIEIKR